MGDGSSCVLSKGRRVVNGMLLVLWPSLTSILCK